MPPGEIGASSFEFYEGIRIFIPGAAVVGLYAGVVATFGLDAPDPADSFVAAAVSALLAGLLLYFIDYPSRGAAFRSGLPDKELENWEIPRTLNRLNLYFVLMDTDVPGGIRSRALYMGSMYRIGIELAYLFFITSMSVLGVALFAPSSGKPELTASIEPVLWVGAGLFALLLVTTTFLNAARASSKSELWKRLLGPIKEFGRSDLVLLLISALLIAGQLLFDAPYLAGAAVAVPGLTWAARYHRGHPGGKHVSTQFALFWLCWCGATLCVLAALDLPQHSTLTLADSVAWIGLGLLAGVTVAARPEKKLRGIYSTQRLWLQMNRKALEGKHVAPWRAREAENPGHSPSANAK
jgi:hypothetical protein